MNFEFSEEQVMLRDSVARYVQDDYDWETRVAIAGSETGIDRAKWQTFAELGWLSIPFAEEHGGFGGGPLDVMVVMEELGKGLVLEPYLATVLLYGGLLQKGGSARQQEARIPSIIDGSSLGAFAYLERQSRFETSDVLTTATANDGGYALNGEKVVVFNGMNADQLIVSARTSGEQSDEQGISLFLVAADAEGIESVSYRMMDGQRVSNIVFKDVQVAADDLVGELDGGHALINAVARDANLALSAEALGIMAQLNAKTAEYARTREQFGVAIGKFQALQHRMVDTFISYEQTKSMLYRAVCALTDDQEDEDQAIHALRMMVDKAGKHIFGEAIQLHGGMGITDELDIGHYAKRLMMINTTFGNGDYHQAKFNALRYN
ncbi:pimeloyl-CoA dehydrogenase small subunit [Halieaceae bacterium IMCC8485]|jgi:alkylation response protein AidB-like acyl-CoA dehydrogenase|uniref:Pimeloyl-CoA dehydrogenase small subunit n=1 Tax=Candidatus Seongchinamella marina TaxID=2518990 RepID=A0ABT3SS39_9GAMM|nr:acyl-CoA dehydrogenase family protein [Candidatus Seongchinamella marina]MCX2972104.1 pimeloyl-CoA dehydrogenase small subunit [Candidatus Seongchinamella marina]